MIHIETRQAVIKFQLARSLFGRAFYYTSAYLVDGLLVDTGCAYTVSELLGALDGHAVHTIVNTHAHEDHIAGNAAVQERFGAAVLAHPKALPVLADPASRRLRLYQRVMWGYPAPSTGAVLGNVVETPRYRFRVIHTPGHSIDHICLFEPHEGWLFTGDAYVGGTDRALRADYNIWNILESLRKLADLDSSCLFPGSGTIRENPREELLAKIRYLEESGGRVLDLHARGWSRRRIREEVFGSEGAIAWFTMGHFSGLNLVRSYIEDRPIFRELSHTKAPPNK
ncbi:MAG: MBL fold metallo-hydrolase [Desulfomonile sp.]|nr:MBL fold metallo-hydrolase [Desulfomonile sp.]